MKKLKQYQPKKLNTKKFHKPKQNEHKKMYDDKEWTKYRFRFLHYNKLCYACGDLAKHVDHLIVHRGDQSLFWKEDNYIPLCHSCHSIVTANFDRHEVQDINGKLKWLKEERERRKINIRVKIVPIKKG